jgi:hypothetical protein
MAAVETTILNRASVPLVAWKISVEYTLSDGRQGRRSITRDVFGTLAGLDPTPAAPAVGAVREVVVVGAPTGRTVETAVATVRCAVFADGSWVGPEREVIEIFENRARELKAWTVVAAALQEGLRLTGHAGLAKALEILNRPDQDDFNHAAKQVMRRNVQRALAGELKVAGDVFLRTWLSRADARVRAAKEFGRRTGERRER